jgi:hypothetical protein
MDPAAHAFHDGIRVTRETLRVWNRRPGPVVGPWVAGGAGAALLLLLAVLTIAALASGSGQPQLGQPPFQVGGPGDVRRILSHNLLVLAFHALACVAGFIAGSQLPIQADYRRGWRRTVHVRGGQAAIAFVIAATVFSLAAQAGTIGVEAARVARALHTSPTLLLLALLPHAVPELTALFLPLAAWVIAGREGDWDQLLAATAVTVAIAIPVLVLCATWEVYGAPHLIASVVGRG